MSIKKSTLKSALFNLLLLIPIFSFAAISAQDQANFKSTYGNTIKSETYTKILNFCDKNDTDIISCLEKLKAQPSKLNSTQQKMGYNRFCCLNVSNQIGEYAYIQGREYCIWPC